MKVKLLTDSGYETPGIAGQVFSVASIDSPSGLVEIRVGDLAQFNEEWADYYEDKTFCFTKDEYEVIEND